MSTPKAIRKQDVLEISYFDYNGYEQIRYVPEKFVITEVMAKLRDKKKTPNFKNILEDITLIFPFDEKSYKKEDGWIKMKVVLK